MHNVMEQNKRLSCALLSGVRMVSEVTDRDRNLSASLVPEA